MRYEVIYLEQDVRRQEFIEASDFSVTGSSQITFYTRGLEANGANDDWGQPRRVQRQRQVAFFSGVVSVKPVGEEEVGILFGDPEIPPPLSPHAHRLTGGPHP